MYELEGDNSLKRKIYNIEASNAVHFYIHIGRFVPNFKR
jgi:hypothetical protein